MAKKPKTIEQIIENITQTSLEEVMHKSMMPYAEHVILERALPRAEDGLKPVQRRILYTMYELGLTPDKPHRKCARIVGDCLGKYHPHGDSSVYDALARMAQDFSMRYPLVDGHGNFGSIDGDSPAAMRYTEARMQSFALEMLRDINKNTVPFVLNFEDELQEPDLLPARYPNLLVNGSSGIAVGLATNIPPHNLKETIDACIAMLNNPDISIPELMEFIIAPDFPTGGSILQSDEIFNAYSTGKGKIKIRAKVEIESSVNGRNKIVVTEIPYQVNKAAMLEKIYKLTEDKGVLAGKIYNIRDESDRAGMRAVIETKKDVDPSQVLAILYKYSDLEVTYGINLVAIANGKPKLLTLKELLYYYIEHQKNVVLLRTKYDLEKSKIKAHILEGLLIALDNIDAIIQLIRKSKNPKTANEALCTTFKLTPTQAQAILDMRLQRLTNLEVITLKNEYEKLVKLITQLEAIINSEKKLIKVIIKELEEIKDNNYSERRTNIVEDVVKDVVLPSKEEKVSPYVISFTSDYRIQKFTKKDSTTKIIIDNDDPNALCLLACNMQSNEKLLLFTNTADVYQISSDAVPSITKKTDKGLMLNAIIDTYKTGERLLYMRPYNNQENNSIVMLTKNGQIKISPISDYLINRSKYNGMKLKTNDEIVSIFEYNPALKQDIIITTHAGYCIRFSLQTINETARMTAGVGAIQLTEGDYVTFSCLDQESANMGIITDKGYAKAIPLSDFEKQNRNGKGYRIINLLKNTSNGNYVAGYFIFKDNITIITKQPKNGITEISTELIPVQNKNGKGLPVVFAVLDDIVEKVIPVNQYEL
ncbi:MAG: DNA topoisomerase (ATP-hydrolyzing) [Eubacteriales bacterium]|nr:DNA topoisomerase (ATP-hydrolyzing) [Eubacteriales bacterium]